MKAGDLINAQKIAEVRAQNVALRDRLSAGDALTLAIGAGGSQMVITLTSSYLARVRSDLVGAFAIRIAENDAALLAMGVEP